MTWPSSAIAFFKAIKRQENTPAEWNNPLSLTAGDAGGYPLAGVANSEGVVKFKFAADGINAGMVKVNRILQGKSKTYPLTMTIMEWGLKYSGGDPNEGKNVALFLGLTPDQPLSAINTKFGLGESAVDSDMGTQ